MGWAGVLVPEENGGVGFRLRRRRPDRRRDRTQSQCDAVAVDSGAGRDCAAPGRLGGAEGSAAARDCAAATMLVALAVDESSRHAPHHVATRATGGSGKFKLNGRKTHVLDGHVADRLIVSARTSGDVESRDGITLFLIDAQGKRRQRHAHIAGRQPQCGCGRIARRRRHRCRGDRHFRQGRAWCSMPCWMQAARCSPQNCSASRRSRSNGRSPICASVSSSA